MAFDGGDVEVFGDGVEECHCWGVDAWEEGTTGVCVAVYPVGVVAIDAVCVRHDDGGRGKRLCSVVL